MRPSFAPNIVEACPPARKKERRTLKSYLKRGTAKNPCRNTKRKYAAWLPRNAPSYFTSTRKISGFSLEATLRCCVRVWVPDGNPRLLSPGPICSRGKGFGLSSPFGEYSWAHPPFSKTILRHRSLLRAHVENETRNILPHFHTWCHVKFLYGKCEICGNNPMRSSVPCSHRAHGQGFSCNPSSICSTLLPHHILIVAAYTPMRQKFTQVTNIHTASTNHDYTLIVLPKHSKRQNQFFGILIAFILA